LSEQPLPTEKLERVADFLFEVGMLKEVPRTGFQYLGSGHESVAEHTARVCFVAWTLARMEPEADPLRLVELALFHDLAEARTGDLNAVSKLYVRSVEERAWQDAAAGLPFGGELEAPLSCERTGASKPCWPTTPTSSRCS